MNPRSRIMAWLVVLAACLVTSAGCGGSSPAPNSAAGPWPAAVEASQAPLGGPPAPPGLPSLDPEAAARAAAGSPASAVIAAEDDETLSLSLANGWNMVSLPVAEVTSTQLGAGIVPFGFAWDAANGTYTTVDLGNAAALNAGGGTARGLWVFSSQPAEFQVTGRPNSGYGADIYADLHQGWNLVGLPYAAPRPLGEIQVRRDGGQALLLTEAVSPEVQTSDPSILLYGFGFLYGAAGYESVGLNNAGNSFPSGRAMWLYVQQDATRFWYQIPEAPPADSTFYGAVPGGELLGLDQDGNLFVGELITPPPPPEPDQPAAEADAGIVVLEFPGGATYRFYVLAEGGMYPLYDGESNEFEVQGTVNHNLGVVELTAGKAVPENRPSQAGGVVATGENTSNPSLESPLLLGTPLNEQVQRGLQAMSSGSYLLARAWLGAAVKNAGSTQSQDADAARFFHALSRVAAMGQELPSDGAADGFNDLGDFLDAAGYDPARRSSFRDLQRPVTLPPTTPTGEDGRRFLNTRVRYEIESAMYGMEQVSPSFVRTWTMNRPLAGGLSAQRAVESDFGDALFFEACFRAVLGSGSIAGSYDLGGSVTDPLNAGTLTRQSALGLFPNLLTHKDLSLLPFAKSTLQLAPSDLQAAIAHILAETDPQADDLVTIPHPDQVQPFSDTLEDWKQAFTQPMPLQDPEGNQASLDLTRFFDADGLPLRQFLCPFDGNEVAGLFQGAPFGDVYTGYTPGSLADPNRDADEDGRPDAVIKAGTAPKEVARWEADPTRVALAVAASPDQSRVYAVLADNPFFAAPSRVAAFTAQGAPAAGWDLTWPNLGFSDRPYVGVDAAGRVVVAGSGYRYGYLTDEASGYARRIQRFEPDGDLLADRDLLVPVAGLHAVDVARADYGGQHGVAVATDGSLWTWGANWDGQLGLGDGATFMDAARQVPSLGSVTSVAAGGNHTLAVGQDGKVYAWGANWDGQLGTGDQVGSPVPVEVPGLSGGGMVAAGYATSYFLRSDGTLFAWGYVGGTSVLEPTPVTDGTGLTAIDVEGNSFGDLVALRTDGQVVIVMDLQAFEVAGLTGVSAVAAGGAHLLALKADGTVWAFGNDQDGQLGDGPGDSSGGLVQCQGLEGVQAIAAGPRHSLALKADGTVMGWGDNSNGELSMDLPLVNPTPVSGIFPDPATGVFGSRSLVRTADGLLWPVGAADYFSRIGGLAVRPDGTFLASVGNQVAFFDATGSFTGFLAPGPGTMYPLGLDVSQDGRLWVADQANNRIRRFSSAGVHEGDVAVPNPGDVDIAPNGEIYVLGALGAERLEADGTRLCRWPAGSNVGLDTLSGHKSLFPVGNDVVIYQFPYAP